MQAHPYWFIQRQCDGRSKIISEDNPAVQYPSTVVYVKTIGNDSCNNCCLCNREFDDYGRWNIHQCCNEALFYFCPNEDCWSLLMEVQRVDCDCIFMQYANSDVWCKSECNYSATN